MSGAVVPLPAGEPVLPLIVLETGSESQAIGQLEHALGAAGTVYTRAGCLVAVASGEPSAALGPRPPEAPSVRLLTQDSLWPLAARAASWSRRRSRGWEPCEPPNRVLRALLAAGEWPNVPPLVAIAEHPAIRPDGSLYAGPGYDRQTGVYVARGLDIPTRTPTRDDARAGLAKLCEAVTDFPFLAGCDRAAWVALVLTLLCRELAENVPAFVIGAPTPGTGKSLLADAAAVVATGRPAPRLPEPRDPEEERKRLIALALEGDRLALIDNLERGFGSGVLALALTSGAIRDRLLGESRTVTAPWRCVLVATANNPTIWGDVQRRVIPIDLDAGVERPEERDGFRHRDLLGWVRSNRPELVGAALDIVRGYLAAGSPEVETGPTFGSFESWERVVRHSIVWAGGADPCEGRARIQAAGDPIQDARRDLLRAWWRVAELRSAHVRELIACPEIAAAFEPLCRRGVTTTTAGQTLGRLKGRPMGGLVARSENDRDGVAVWTVSPAGVAGVAGVIPGPTRDETRNTQERETTPATPATPAPGAGKVVPL